MPDETVSLDKNGEAAPLPVDPASMQAEIDAAIAECGGDTRATIAVLLADNNALSDELGFARLAMSYGFARGWFAKRQAQRKYGKAV